MPTSVAAFLAIEVIGTVTIGAILANIALAYAINAIFAPRRRGQQFDDLASRVLNQIQSDAPWRVIYGQIRAGGVIVFRHATDTLGQDQTNEFANIPISAPFTVQVQQAAIYISTRSVRERIRRNEEYEYIPFSAVGANPAAGQYSVAGGVYTFNSADAGKHMHIQYYRTVTATAHNRLHLVLVLAAHECQEIGDIYFNDELIPLDGSGNATGKYAEHVYVSKHLGADDQAADATLMAESPSKWTTNHRLRGHAYLYVRLLQNRDLFPSGVPNISALVKGRKVFDSRTSTTAWSANAALCNADYLNHPKVGVNAPYTTEIDTTLLNAAANVCDENVALAAGGTEKRYTCNGMISTAETPEEIIGKLLTSMSGRLVYVSGNWRYRAGAYVTPAVTLDEGDLRGAIQVTSRLSRQDACNAVKGVYVSPDNNWQPSDFPPLASAIFMVEDNGERIWRDLELPFTTSAATAQRIAKIELLRARQQISAELPFKLGAYRIEPPETLMITNTRLGWSAKVFELIQSRLVLENNVLGVDGILRETASSVFDWLSSEEQAVDPAPDTDLPNPFVIVAPGNPVIVETLVETRDGRGIASKADVSWAASGDGQVLRYDLEWKERAATSWQKAHGLFGITFEILDLPAGNHQFRVRATNALGVTSDWSETEHEILGLGAPPATPVITGIQAIGGLAIITVQSHPDLDVRRGGRWRIRHVQENAIVAWDTAFTIGDPDSWVGDQSVLVVPLKPGTYLIRSEDAVGTQSTAYALIETKQASVNTFSTLSTLQEDGTFAGTHSGTAATGGVLTIGGIGMFDDIPDFDAVTELDGYGGIATLGTYTFAAGYDHGSVGHLRLTSQIVGLTVNLNDLIDDRTGNVDDWLDFDGTQEIGGGSSDAWLEFRETDDDPAGAPVWSDWKRVDAAEVEARGIQCRAKLSSLDAAYRPEITELRVKIAKLV